MVGELKIPLFDINPNKRFILAKKTNLKGSISCFEVWVVFDLQASILSAIFFIDRVDGTTRENDYMIEALHVRLAERSRFG
jgi:hypothetical protein